MFEPIQTERLILRILVPGDADLVYQYRSDPEVSKFQTWAPKTPDDNLKFIEQLAQTKPNTPGTWLQLAIVITESNTLIGDCGIRFPADDNYQTELGITLERSFQNQGYAIEALYGIFDYVFKTLKKHRLFASIDPGNSSAIALMKRVGMRQEAHFKESLMIDGHWVDDMIFAMLDREWHNRNH